MKTPYIHTKSVRFTRLALSVSLLAMLAQGQMAFAQDAADEEDDGIIVTATKREVNLQDIPFSINAQTAEDIQKSGAVTLEDLSRNVAGLAVQNLGPGQSQVSIRGISAGQVVRDQPGVKEQVGVYMDESPVSMSLFTPDFDLFDLNRVETLRGPQGTLFGSGSIGGTVRYITNQPKLGTTEGAVEANLNLVDGDDLGGHLKGAVNIPLGDQVALRAVAYYTRYGGFINARREGGAIDEDVNNGERYGGRLSFLIQPSDNLTIVPRVVWQRVVTNGFNRQEVYNLYANRFNTTRPAVTFNEREQFLRLNEKFRDNTVLADATISLDLGGAELTSVSTYIQRDILVSRDASALTGSVSVDLGYPAAAVLLPSNLRDTTDLETFSQEVRLASSGDGPFQWLIGGFYSKIDRVYAQRLPTPGYDAATDAALGAGTSNAVANGFGPNSPFNSDLPYDIKQLAVFGEATYNFSDQLSLTAGARYYDFEEVRSITTGGLFADTVTGRIDRTKSDGISPRILLSYDVSDDVTINAQAAKGFRLGGVNDPLNVPLCSPADLALFGGFQDYTDESLWNYELGVKSKLGNGITFNAAAFRSEIKNLQVTLDAGSCSSRIVFNVPKSHTQGLEFELTAKPVDSIEIGLSGSLLESEIDSTLPGALATATGIRDGNRLPSTPKFQISGNITYSFPVGGSGEGYVNLSGQHVGTRYTQPADQENNPRTFTHNLPFGGQPAGSATTLNLLLPSYELVNLSAGVDLDSGLSFSVYVNNLLDENALLAFDRERGGRARLGYHVGQPRTFGVTARQKF
jgi:iron complex outermembrane recepter protein